MVDLRIAELEREILSEVHPLVVQRAEPLVRRVIRQYSRYLAENMTGGLGVRQTRDGLQSSFLLEQYWAEILHDGRGPIEAPPGKLLVYFPNIANDPRVPLGVGGLPDYPDRPSDIVSLTKDQFKLGMLRNVALGWNAFGTQNLGSGTALPYMRAVRSVGRADAKLWFDLDYPAGTDGISDRLNVDGRITRTISREILSKIPTGEIVSRLGIR